MLSGQRTSYCYDLADAAYCNEDLRELSRQQGHVVLFDHNPRRGDKKEFEEFVKKHYAARSGAERVNARLKSR